MHCKKKVSFRSGSALGMAVLISAFALSACGGGGGSSSPATTPAATTPAPTTKTIALVPAPGAGSSTFTATGDFPTDALAFLNFQRAQVGMPALTVQSGIAQAALNHSLWEQGQNTVSHVETAGQAGFTGVNSIDRVNKYFASSIVGEVTTDYISGLGGTANSAMSDLFDAPFHRGAMLMNWLYAGAGQAAGDSLHFSFITVDFATTDSVDRDTQLVAWPYDGQVNANTSWKDNETPDPMAGTAYARGTTGAPIVGYPITLQGFNAAQFSNVTFKVTDATGAAVSCIELDSSNSTEAQADMLAECTPTTPLATNTKYTVTVTGKLSNASFAATPFSVTWSFTTAATANVFQPV